ncbi:MAG: FRG domain-containing protein [Syntrophales bacterium]|nr:FRG domain-containing protein [Syntrophales bacterium]
MEKRWYEFTDESKTEIKGSYAIRQDDSHGPQELIDESDPRVQAFLGPMWARAKYQEFDIASVDQFLKVLSSFDGSPLPLWRGQPNAAWPLTTAIERGRDATIIKEIGLHTYELRILTEARRRAHHHAVDHPLLDDLLGWLSFLRHHGAPTRLLDVTKSPYVAAFFAIETGFDQYDGAVWMFNQFHLQLGLHTLIMKSDKPFYKHGNFGVLVDSYQSPTVKVTLQESKTYTHKDLIFGGPWQLIELALQGSLAIEGMMAVEAGQWLDRRQDVQQGSFLFPLNLRSSFQQNLESIVGVPLTDVKESPLRVFPEDKKVIQIVGSNAAVMKFIVSASLKRDMRHLLERMNLRPSVLFPDHEGHIMELRNLVPPKGTWKQERRKTMPRTFRRSDITVQKSLTPPFSTVVGVDSDDLGYEASYDGYSSTGDTEDDAIDNLVDKLQDKGYEED